MASSRTILAFLLWFALAPLCRAETAAAVSSASCPVARRTMQRTGLIFGTQRAGRPPVSEAQWRAFMTRELLPRFPDGATFLDGVGQWRAKNGAVVRERSHILLLWHDGSAATNERIEEVRALFKKRFGQESVMRIDGADCVSF